MAGPNVCGALYSVKNRLREGTKAAISVEAAISTIQETLGKFKISGACWSPDA